MVTLADETHFVVQDVVETPDSFENRLAIEFQYNLGDIILLDIRRLRVPIHGEVDPKVAKMIKKLKKDLKKFLEAWVISTGVVEKEALWAELKNRVIGNLQDVPRNLSMYPMLKHPEHVEVHLYVLNPIS